jgi:hypothetical protein
MVTPRTAHPKWIILYQLALLNRDRQGADRIRKHLMTKSAFIVLLLAVCMTVSCKKGITNKDVKSPASATPSPYSSKAKEPMGLFPAKVKGRYGFIDKTGKMILQPQFARAQMFSEGLAAVQINAKWGFIDRTGKMVITPKYDVVLPFAEGLASVRGASGHFGCINKAGEIVITPQTRFGGISQFSEGLAATLMSDVAQGIAISAWGFIDTNGKFVISPAYDGVTSFSEGLAAVRAAGKKWGYVDKTTKYQIQPLFETANRFSEGLASVESTLRSQYKWGFIDHTGKFAIPPQYSLARTFSEGFAGAQYGDVKWGFVDKSGKWAIPPKYDDIAQFNEGLALVQLGGKENYIDRTGKVIWAQQ